MSWDRAVGGALLPDRYVLMIRETLVTTSTPSRRLAGLLTACHLNKQLLQQLKRTSFVTTGPRPGQAGRPGAAWTATRREARGVGGVWSDLCAHDMYAYLGCEWRFFPLSLAFISSIFLLHPQLWVCTISPYSAMLLLATLFDCDSYY